jgi:hypothetical protein
MQDNFRTAIDALLDEMWYITVMLKVQVKTPVEGRIFH